jgi:hypothetical protein
MEPACQHKGVTNFRHRVRIKIRTPHRGKTNHQMAPRANSKRFRHALHTGIRLLYSVSGDATSRTCSGSWPKRAKRAKRNYFVARSWWARVPPARLRAEQMRQRHRLVRSALWTLYVDKTDHWSQSPVCRCRLPIVSTCFAQNVQGEHSGDRRHGNLPIRSYFASCRMQCFYVGDGKFSCTYRHFSVQKDWVEWVALCSPTVAD